MPKYDEMPTVFYPADDEEWDPEVPEQGLFHSPQFVRVSHFLRSDFAL